MESNEITVGPTLGIDFEGEELQEPLVAQAEPRTGELADVVSLLRQASNSTRDAHALACRRRRSHRVVRADPINRVQTEALDQAVRDTEHAKAEALAALQHVAAVPPQLFRR